MIEETQVTIRKQTAADGMWLYQDSSNDRIFAKSVYLGKNADPWVECTDADKQAWEEEHRPEPTPEPEVQEAEVIDE